MLRFCLCLTVLILSGIISNPQVAAQAPDSTEDKLKSELPERVLVTIIDTTMIQLVQRERFTDAVRPEMDEYLGVYAKERPWNLPDILTPTKFIVSPNPKLLKDSAAILTVYPSLPNALFYQGSLAGRFEDMDGLLYFNRHNLSDNRTKNRGRYNVDNFRGVWNYHHGALTDFRLDVRYDAKNLGWLRFPKEDGILRKDVALFNANFDWRQRFYPDSQSAISFDFTTFRMDSQDGDDVDRGMDVALNWGITTYWPFTNPIDFGAGVEYSIATDKYPDTSKEEQFWTPIFRLYFREKFINLGGFNFRADAEAVGFRESKTDVGNRTYVKFCPGVNITTKLSDNLIFQLGGNRTINRKSYAELYLYDDYIALNPFLKHSKTWSANTTLKLHSKDVNIEATGFAQIVDDLVFLNRTEYVKDISAGLLGELSWTPDNLDAHIFGGQVKIDLFLAQGMNASIQFTHEFQQPQGEVERIPYRPQDIMSLNLSYSSPSGFGFNLTGEANGSRFYDLDSDDTLPPYFLWRMRINQTFSQHITAFIGGQFSSGRYELLKGYELPQQAVDLGISLKF
ncbi:TPA: hypothetical protein EYP66_10930 [Candidatus Poribacteria bacterium]|nr:hypothetical protein [Candidatus Poribacteria bacterium]